MTVSVYTKETSMSYWWDFSEHLNSKSEHLKFKMNYNKKKKHLNTRLVMPTHTVAYWSLYEANRQQQSFKSRHVP